MEGKEELDQGTLGLGEQEWNGSLFIGSGKGILKMKEEIYRIRLDQEHNFYSVKIIVNENLTYLNFIQKTY